MSRINNIRSLQRDSLSQPAGFFRWGSLSWALSCRPEFCGASGCATTAQQTGFSRAQQARDVTRRTQSCTRVRTGRRIKTTTLCVQRWAPHAVRKGWEHYHPLRTGFSSLADRIFRSRCTCMNAGKRIPPNGKTERKNGVCPEARQTTPPGNAPTRPGTPRMQGMLATAP